MQVKVVLLFRILF